MQSRFYDCRSLWRKPENEKRKKKEKITNKPLLFTSGSLTDDGMMSGKVSRSAGTRPARLMRPDPRWGGGAPSLLSSRQSESELRKTPGPARTPHTERRRASSHQRRKTPEGRRDGATPEPESTGPPGLYQTEGVMPGTRHSALERRGPASLRPKPSKTYLRPILLRQQ